jgi:hypothetical protein
VGAKAKTIGKSNEVTNTVPIAPKANLRLVVTLNGLRMTMRGGFFAET